MDEVIRQVNNLTVRDLQHELRKRRLMVSGIKADLRRRLIEDLRTDYDNGWTCGKLLNVRLIPFSGDGIDPQTLIGRHVTCIDEANSRGTVKLSFADNNPLFISSQRTTTAADLLILYRDVEARVLEWPCAKSPMRILGAGMAELKDEYGKMFFILGIKGIGTNLYIDYDQVEGRSDTGLRGLYLAAHEA